jgi:glycosyltransferase involved in cell wall biosynthesis
MQVVRNIPLKQIKPIHYISRVSPINARGRKVILYQGAVNHGRGIEWMIDAMPFLSNYIFYVVGEGDILKKLKEKVKKMHLTEKVFFTGKIPFEDLPVYTARADIGINLLENWGLSDYYSLPNRIFEYIRDGVPIVASDFPEIRKIVTRYDIGALIHNFDPQYIASTIKRLTLKGKNHTAFATANAELCWENEAAVLLKVMKNATFNYINSIIKLHK